MNSETWAIWMQAVGSTLETVRNATLHLDAVGWAEGVARLWQGKITHQSRPS